MTLTYFNVGSRTTAQRLEEKLKDVEKCYKLTYEDLTDDVIITLKKIIEWLPVKKKEIDIKNFFEFHKKKRPIVNMNDLSIKNLTAMQIQSINKVASGALKKYGYPVLLDQ